MGRLGKRARAEEAANELPTVSVFFQHLPKESKDKLQQALVEWAQWHAKEYPPQVLDMLGLPRVSGKVQYDPALAAGEHGHAWTDIPLGVATDGRRPDFNIHYEMECNVPQYDRSCNALELPSPASDRAKAKGHILAPPPSRAAQRCFNCGSYSHGIRDCWRQRDDSAIDQARASVGPTRSGSKRYFKEEAARSDASEFADLRPGSLSEELREALGLGPLDAPPWLNKMRALGYPPGYISHPQATSITLAVDTFDFLDDAHAQPVNVLSLDCATGLDGATVASGVSSDDFIPFMGSQPDMDLSDDVPAAGEELAPPPPPPPPSLPEASISAESRGRPPAPQQLVAFPGINAPLPEGADPAAWAPREPASLSSPPPSTHRQPLQGRATAASIPIPAKRPRLATSASDSATLHHAANGHDAGLLANGMHHQGLHNLHAHWQGHAVHHGAHSAWSGQAQSGGGPPSGPHEVARHAGQWQHHSWGPGELHQQPHAPPASPFTLPPPPPHPPPLHPSNAFAQQDPAGWLPPPPGLVHGPSASFSEQRSYSFHG